MDVSIYDIDSEDWNPNRIGIMTGAMTDIRDEVLVLSKIDVLKWELYLNGIMSIGLL